MPIDPRSWIDDIVIGIGVAIGVVGAAGTGAPAPGGNPPAQSPPPATPSQPAGPAPTPPAADAQNAWGRTISWEQAKEIVDREIPPGERHNYDYDGTRDGSGDWYQCTTWAKARWREMGFTGDWRGDGAEVAHNINAQLGRPDSKVPTVGAIVSFSSGHVAVVERVFYAPDGSPTGFEVSEMNYNHNADRFGRTDWRIARANEFGTRRVTLDPSGQTFAAFPG